MSVLVLNLKHIYTSDLSALLVHHSDLRMYSGRRQEMRDTWQKAEDT